MTQYVNPPTPITPTPENPGLIEMEKPDVGPYVDGTQLKNADMNLSQYGDDSSAANYNNPALWGGENGKYTGETTKNSQVAYDPNMTIEGLDPDYKYGAEAQIANSQQANYIASRNDNIASALYNAGTTSLDDVSNFLNTQQGFFNSNENERQNTIQSIYKRLGDLQKQQEQEQPKENKDVASEMRKDEATGKIYGKVTAEEGAPMQGIDTLSEGYAINQQIMEARIKKVQALQNMGPENIATSVYFGTTPYGEQAMRDYRQYDPEGYQAYQKALNAMYSQDKVNNISHGAATDETSKFIDSTDKTIENDIKDWEKANYNENTEELTKGYLENKLSSNQTATTAKQEMMNIKAQIAEIEDQIDNLPKEARAAFKGDVPDYIYKAYISNNEQRLQRELNKLQSRYTGLADIYKTEVSNAQREAEYNLKIQDFNRQITNDRFNQYIQTAKLELDQIQRGTDSKGNIVGFKYDPATNSMVQVTDETAIQSYNQGVEKISNYARGLVGQSTGKQCMGFTNMLTKQTAGVQMLGANADGTSNTNPTLDERIEYATNPNVSDVIPVAGDVGVMISNGKNGVSPVWGHTVYVDKVYTDNAGNTRIHYLATNTGKEGEETLAYERDVALQDWYNNGGVGFWNPFKQAQYNKGGSSYDSSIYLDPMEAIVDTKYKEGDLSVTKETVLSRFWSSYNKLYSAREDNGLIDLLNDDAFSLFLKDFSFDADEVGNGGSSTAGDLVSTFMDQIKQAGAKYFNGNGYNAFLGMMGVLETKLRDESGARINNGEWKMDFMEYVPESSDNPERRLWKINNLEKYLRAYAKRGGITADEYIPLFDIYGVGSDGKIYDKRKGTTTSDKKGKNVKNANFTRVYN